MANEAAKTEALEKADQRAAHLNQLRQELQKLTDPAKRKAFYEANPELREFVSPVNFHV